MGDSDLSSKIVNEPQPVTDAPGWHAIFMVLRIVDTPQARSTVRGFCEDFSALVRSMMLRDRERSIRGVMGFGSDAWDKLFGFPRPAKLHTFEEVRGSVHVAPSTPGDLFFHIRANTMDVCFEFARQIMAKLGNAVLPEDEVHGFRYFDARSMVGFVDGTENPTGLEAYEFAVIGDEDEAFSGGSYVFVQKYLHDMDGWNKLSTEEQEKAIGRHKFDDIELDDDVKPTNAHNALTNITDEEGNELKIVRDNLPFGNPSANEFGTYFIGYSKDPEVTETMVRNMFIGDPPGNHDRLLDFSTAVTGTLFFVPSQTLLDSLPEREAQPVGAAPQSIETDPAPSRRSADGSLLVGSLKQDPQKL